MEKSGKIKSLEEMFQYDDLLFRHFNDIANMRDEKSGWDDVDIDTPQELPQNMHLEIFATGREVGDGITGTYGF